MKEHNPEYWKDYDERCRALEAEGLTRSDAQGVIGAEDMQKPVAHCSAEIADWLDPGGSLRAAGLLVADLP